VVVAAGAAAVVAAGAAAVVAAGAATVAGAATGAVAGAGVASGAGAASSFEQAARMRAAATRVALVRLFMEMQSERGGRKRRIYLVDYYEHKNVALQHNAMG
jgi:hypothetical protein